VASSSNRRPNDTDWPDHNVIRIGVTRFRKTRNCCSCKGGILLTFVSRRSQQCSNGRLDEAATCRSGFSGYRRLRQVMTDERSGSGLNRTCACWAGLLMGLRFRSVYSQGEQAHKEFFFPETICICLSSIFSPLL
jgi:hypothetical protein